MSSNNRIFYACQAVAINNCGKTTVDSGDMVHGVQSVGINTSFNLEQAFELGQIEIYENIEGIPEVEVTLEKVIDGYPLMYLMASTGVFGTSSSGLASRAKQKCNVRLGIFDENENNVAGQTSEVEVYCSGMYISSIGYTFPAEGNATESITLVGNNKSWLTGASTEIETADVAGFDGEDEPLAGGSTNYPSGGIQRREDVMLDLSILPSIINGVVGTGVGNSWNSSSLTPRVHLQNISINTDFSREDILELGRKTPYYRPAGFPIEVTCEIEAITTSGDFVTALEGGNPSYYATKNSGNNTSEDIIFIRLRAGMAFDLGNKNRLTSVSYGGGDAGGGNVSTTYSFNNFNVLKVKQDFHNSPADMAYGVDGV